jgi:hypothetical protein
LFSKVPEGLPLSSVSAVKNDFEGPRYSLRSSIKVSPTSFKDFLNIDLPLGRETSVKREDKVRLKNEKNFIDAKPQLEGKARHQLVKT